MARQLDPTLPPSQVSLLTDTQLLQDIRALLIALVDTNEQQLVLLGGPLKPINLPPSTDLVSGLPLPNM